MTKMTMVIGKAYCWPLAAALMAGLLATPASAATVDKDIVLEVTYQIPTCQIKGVNGESNIAVKFGDIRLNKIDGLQYSQPIPFDLHCEGSLSALELVLQGMATQQGGLAVTGEPGEGLELKLLADDQPITLNQPFAIDLNQLPQLRAVPQRLAGTELSTGAFTAVASLQVTYQ